MHRPLEVCAHPVPHALQLRCRYYSPRIVDPAAATTRDLANVQGCQCCRLVHTERLSAPAAMDKLARVRFAAARQRPPPDAEIVFGGEVSSLCSSISAISNGTCDSENGVYGSPRLPTG